MLSRTLVLRIANWAPMKSLITRSRVSRNLVRRFVAGENIDDAVDATRALNADGMTVSLDFLGENSTTKDEAIAASQTYSSILHRINETGITADISIKLTQIGLDFGEAFCKDNLMKLLETAANYNNEVQIDMESSNYTQSTLNLFCQIYEHYKNCGTVIQAYLKRSADDVDMLNSIGAKVRLVKGAYLEPAEVAYQQMERINENFDALTEKLLLKGNYPAIATHDVKRINRALEIIKKNDIPPDKYEFQMLYGIRRDLQQKIIKSNKRVRIYLPYGSAWYPYFSRRLAERPANILFVIKNFFK